jgi:hypothetical protein
MYKNKEQIIQSMIGRVFKKVDKSDDELIFIPVNENESSVVFYHDQDCCETVRIEEIFGDLSDLENTPILDAREDSPDDPNVSKFYLLTDETLDEYSYWYFYNFRTIKGSVTVRWFGSSNGYYSTEVHVK